MEGKRYDFFCLFCGTNSYGVIIVCADVNVTGLETDGEGYVTLEFVSKQIITYLGLWVTIVCIPWRPYSHHYGMCYQ